MAIIIDGKAVAREVRANVKARVEALAAKGTTAGLAVVLVGNDPASETYVASKERACGWVGMHSEMVRLPEHCGEAAVLATIERLNADPRIHGILVQHPVPSYMDERKIFSAIAPEKDVDGFHPLNAGRLLIDRAALEPCTPRGIIELLKRYDVPLQGANAVVIGRSTIVGKPVAMMLMREQCTVTICHSRTADLAAHTRRADIVVAAVGRPRILTGDMIAPGAAVIDVGINRQPDGMLVGDVDFETVAPVAGWITPVPGGVGPMTIAMLLNNTITAAEIYG